MLATNHQDPPNLRRRRRRNERETNLPPSPDNPIGITMAVKMKNIEEKKKERTRQAPIILSFGVDSRDRFLSCSIFYDYLFFSFFFFFSFGGNCGRRRRSARHLAWWLQPFQRAKVKKKKEEKIYLFYTHPYVEDKKKMNKMEKNPEGSYLYPSPKEG